MPFFMIVALIKRNATDMTVRAIIISSSWNIASHLPPNGTVPPSMTIASRQMGLFRRI
jgi:hypothetical protein